MQYDSLMFKHPGAVRPLTAGPLAIGLLALTMSGCSGSGGSSVEPALTKAQYIKQADAICSKVDQKQLSTLSAYAKKHPKRKGSQSAQEAFVAIGLSLVKVGIEEIRSLSSPTDDSQAVDSMLDEMDAALKKSEEEPTTVVTGVKNPFEEVNQRTAKYGFEACSQLP
jgi:hypothetical protein